MSCSAGVSYPIRQGAACMLPRRLSPLSQKVTLRELQEGAGKTLAESLRMEFRQVHHCIHGRTDFVEGIRALLIDKTGQSPSGTRPTIEQALLFAHSPAVTINTCA